jgi:hypothetical protein
MVLTDALTTKLLGAIEADSLILLCGAGLSMAPPSYLPSAKTVAELCYDDWSAIEVLDPRFRNDIDLLAGHFYAQGNFEKLFIRRLVPWNELVGPPNKGHAAIADLLMSRAAHAALSANFDRMIESWAEPRKIDLQGALTGQEAIDFASVANPLIKFHGCMHRARSGTLWTQGQLAEPAFQARVRSCSEWMNQNLPGRHLAVVGFWTDWGYLNDVFANAFAIDNASSVTVIDPSPTADLQSKAPNLWSRLNALSHAFEHVRASGDDALDELRTAYSKTWARRFYKLGEPLVQATGATVAVPAPFDALGCEDLYNLRRDVEGVPYSRAATLKVPAPSSQQAAYVHMMLLNAGATTQGAWLEHAGQTIRIVNGGGRAIAEVRSEYKEPATMLPSDIVVCAGAIDLAVPATLIAPGRGASTIRPTPGGGAAWLTLDQAKAVLGI